MRIGKVTARSIWFDQLSILLATLVAMIGIVLACPAEIQAATFPGATGIPQPPADQSSFENYLSAIGRPVASRYHGYIASFATFEHDHLLVYGTPQQVPNNPYSVLYQEYAYLGFSFDETLVTNSNFPDDSSTGETYSNPWTWQERELGLLAEISWARLNARQQELIRSSQLYYRRRSYGGMTFTGLGLNSMTSQVLTQPSWHLGFALYTRHFLPGTTTLRYATLTGKGSGDAVVRCELNLLTPLSGNDTLHIPEDEDRVDLKYNISGSIFDYAGLAEATDIAYCGVGNDLSWTAGSGSGPWTIPVTQTIDRDFLGSETSKKLTLRGQAWVVSRMGDIRIAEAQRVITVTSDPASPFQVELNVSGSLNYFANRRKAADYHPDRDRHRYLGLETVTFTADFTHPPQSATIEFLGHREDLETNSNQTHYEWSVELPLDRSTLSWQNRRIGSPWTARITATAEIEISNPAETSATGTEQTQPPAPATETVAATAQISDLEITGDIHDLYRVLAG